MSDLDKALQLRPQSSMVLQAKGSVYLNQNDLSEAIAIYNRALEIDPNYAPLWRDLGSALNLQNQYGQAIEAFNQSKLTSTL